MKNSNYQNISPELKKIMNIEYLLLYGDDSNEDRDLIYRDSEISTWELVLSYIAMDIRYNSRFSTTKEWVQFLVEERGKKEGTIYAAINKMKKKRVLLELEYNKCLFPSFIVAYYLGIVKHPIMRKALLSDPIERGTLEYLRDRKNQIIKDFIKRHYLEK